MSYTNLIKETLDILDLNITFNEICLKNESIKGRICQVFSGTLDYAAHVCPHYEGEEKEAIIRWGFTSCLILLNDVSEYQTHLRLKKRRFFCQSCNRSFVAKTSLVEKHCSISTKVKLSIADLLRKTTSMSEIARQKKVSVSSMSEIARQKKVSVSSVYRVLKRFYEPKKINRLTFRTYLTETKVVDRLLAYDDELKSGYTCYQDFLYAVQTRDFARFCALLDEDFCRLPTYYQTTIGTFKKYKNEIKNALELPYSNGPLECLNNHIKVLKRNAYGFRNFYNFKLRISLCFGTILFQENRKT